jgi:hypothetical protein
MGIGFKTRGLNQSQQRFQEKAFPQNQEETQWSKW